MRPSLFVLAILLAAACSVDGTTALPADPCAPNFSFGARSSSAAGTTTWAVLPQATDGCVTQRLDSHFVNRATDVSSVGRLFVFLPGTGAIAQNYRSIVFEAARAGYHAIGLSYPNTQAVGTACLGQPTVCYAEVRSEVLTGEASSLLVTVDRANSIENRLVKLLRYMRSADAAGNWGQYLAGDSAVVWAKVSIAGHSQGGGHALFIAKRYAVWRATAYASAGDLLPGGGAAPWVALPFATASSAMFGFISTADELVSPTEALARWTALGMTGAAVNVDSAPPPFGAAQRFVTTATPQNPGIVVGPNHNAVVVDVNTPTVLGIGAPVFRSVWKALSFP
ncbi:MAG: hypothetical protein K8S21_05070 [Gemmatimonadetes bacterium]|nr:hypothetical protein [Gemmatimonadota bacterium]